MSLPLKATRQDAVIKPIEANEPEKPNYSQVPEESIEEPETVHENSVSVLVVEDNADVARYIGMQIGHEYQLYFAHDGVEGLEKALSLMPDLILTDLLMPRKDGLEMCREIKMSEVLNHIPVIMITARSTDADKLMGLEAGADAYLVKPFSADELKLRIRNLIKQREVMREKYALSSNVHVNNMTALNKLDKEFLHKFIDYVYVHMNNGTVSVESVAADLCMTPKQLRSKTVAITGENPSAYIQKIRLEKAQRMLQVEPNMSIGEIALKCGFEDFAYFSRVFKKKNGVMPSQYRRLPS